MSPETYDLTGVVYSLELRGSGGPTSNDGTIGVSPDGSDKDVTAIYLTGPGSNEIHKVTTEQYMSRVAAIYRSYCLRLPLTYTLLDGASSLPLIMSIDMEI